MSALPHVTEHEAKPRSSGVVSVCKIRPQSHLRVRLQGSVLISSSCSRGPVIPGQGEYRGTASSRCPDLCRVPWPVRLPAGPSDLHLGSASGWASGASSLRPPGPALCLHGPGLRKPECGGPPGPLLHARPAWHHRRGAAGLSQRLSGRAAQGFVAGGSDSFSCLLLGRSAC